MEKSCPLSLPSELRAARTDIDRWRASSARRRRIPETFWLRAVELAERHSINSISQAMRLSHERIKARIAGTADTKVRRSASARFVELKPSAATVHAALPSGLTLRLSDGTSRRIEVSGADGACACQLVAAFFGDVAS